MTATTATTTTTHVVVLVVLSCLFTVTTVTSTICPSFDNCTSSCPCVTGLCCSKFSFCGGDANVLKSYGRDPNEYDPANYYCAPENCTGGVCTGTPPQPGTLPPRFPLPPVTPVGTLPPPLFPPPPPPVYLREASIQFNTLDDNKNDNTWWTASLLNSTRTITYAVQEYRAKEEYPNNSQKGPYDLAITSQTWTKATLLAIPTYLRIYITPNNFFKIDTWIFKVTLVLFFTDDSKLTTINNRVTLTQDSSLIDITLADF